MEALRLSSSSDWRERAFFLMFTTQGKMNMVEKQCPPGCQPHLQTIVSPLPQMKLPVRQYSMSVTVPHPFKSSSNCAACLQVQRSSTWGTWSFSTASTAVSFKPSVNMMFVTVLVLWIYAQKYVQSAKKKHLCPRGEKSLSQIDIFMSPGRWDIVCLSLSAKPSPAQKRMTFWIGWYASHK